MDKDIVILTNETFNKLKNEGDFDDTHFHPADAKHPVTFYINGKRYALYGTVDVQFGIDEPEKEVELYAEYDQVYTSDLIQWLDENENERDAAVKEIAKDTNVDRSRPLDEELKEYIDGVHDKIYSELVDFWNYDLGYNTAANRHAFGHGAVHTITNYLRKFPRYDEIYEISVICGDINNPPSLIRENELAFDCHIKYGIMKMRMDINFPHIKVKPA